MRRNTSNYAPGQCSPCLEGWTRMERLGAIGDGAEWIWNLVDERFPGANSKPGFTSIYRLPTLHISGRNLVIN
jgi:hypothetical protein